MNIREQDVLKAIADKPIVNQRFLSEICGLSVGSVNKSLCTLREAGYLDSNYALTEESRKIIKQNSPKRAVILAAGFGMRMVPINLETPKALIEVKGEPLIERTIRQLHEIGVKEVHVVVGFMKEAFDYLIDKYGVNLIVNESYASKNNLHSLRLAKKYLKNAYVVPCDIWCEQNPFNRYELNSWYMVADSLDAESTVRVNRKMELVSVSGQNRGNRMIGYAYLTGEQASIVRNLLERFDQDGRYDGAFWEETLVEKDRMIVGANVVSSEKFVEINTYEQLRDLDGDSDHLKTDAIDVISGVFDVDSKEIRNIAVLKKGMTNRSFLFSCLGKKYIMRIPGEGTSALINRLQEADVYGAISGKGICDDVVYINPQNGYKITEFLKDVRVCNPCNDDDLIVCMDKLRRFHNLKLKVAHEFDIFGQIEFYEKLRNGAPSVFRDYEQTKQNVLSLRPFIERNVGEKVLTHIDAIPDNFLFSKDYSGKTVVSLIDWEYAGMQDPHVDLAMFCIYSYYDQKQTDHLLDIYFKNRCPKVIRLKVYAYMAVCGFLWSNWCEYKRGLGVEFGEYHSRQYRYAKDFFNLVKMYGALQDV